MHDILILVGHGWTDPGAHGHSLENGSLMKESAINLNVALRMRDKFVATGKVRVTMSRETDIYVSPAEQKKLAKSRKWAAIIAVHHNAGGGKGWEVLYNPPIHGPSHRLAVCIGNQFAARCPGHGLGVVDSPRHLFLDDVESPAVFTEGAYLDTVDIGRVDTLKEQWVEANDIVYGTMVFLGEV